MGLIRLLSLICVSLGVGLFVSAGWAAGPDEPHSVPEVACDGPLLESELNVIHSIEGVIGEVTALAPSSNGSVAVAYRDHFEHHSKVKFFNSRGEEKNDFDLHDIFGLDTDDTYGVTALAFHSPSNSLIIGDSRKNIFLLDASDDAQRVKDSFQALRPERLFIPSQDTPRFVQFISRNDALIIGDHGSLQRLELLDGGARMKVFTFKDKANLDHPIFSVYGDFKKYFLFSDSQYPGYVKVYDFNSKRSDWENLQVSFLDNQKSLKTAIDYLGNHELAIAESINDKDASSLIRSRKTRVRIYGDDVMAIAGDKQWPLEWELELPQDNFSIQKILSSKDHSKLLLVGMDYHYDAQNFNWSFAPAVRFMVVDRASKQVVKTWKQFEKPEDQSFGLAPSSRIGELKHPPLLVTDQGRSIWVAGFVKRNPDSALDTWNKIYKLDVESLFRFAGVNR